MTSFFDEKKLAEFKKPHLVELVLELQKEKNNLLSQQQTKMKQMDDRLIELERSHYLYLQYGRRESIEISGIPSNIQQKELETEVIKIYNEARVKIHGRELTQMDIAACHRVGKRGDTIVRFVNRKFAMEGLYHGKNLKGSKLYDTPIYINNSFCREFKKYGYFIRKLKRKSLIAGYKIKNGVFQIRKEIDGEFVEISHISDFEKYALDIDGL